MTQPTLILSILKDVSLWENGGKNKATSRTTPANSMKHSEVIRREKTSMTRISITDKS
jgi:hypothetical protein